MKMISFRPFLFGFLLCALGTAGAAPILWTLQGFTLNDGGTASGSFIYDADTKAISNLGITTTTGSARVGSTYTTFNPNVTNTANGFQAARSPTFTVRSPGLIFGFGTLTDAGGTIVPPFISFSEGSYGDINLNGIVVDSTYRQSTAGFLTTNPSSAPEPTSLILGSEALRCFSLNVVALSFSSQLACRFCRTTY